MREADRNTGLKQLRVPRSNENRRSTRHQFKLEQEQKAQRGPLGALAQGRVAAKRFAPPAQHDPGARAMVHWTKLERGVSRQGLPLRNWTRGGAGGSRPVVVISSAIRSGSEVWKKGEMHNGRCDEKGRRKETSR